MRKLMVRLFVFISLAIGDILSAKAQSDQEKLPFNISVTQIPFKNQPDYFGGGQGNRWCSDFPYCFVMIDGKYWAIYKSGDGPTVYRWKGTNIENCKKQPDGYAAFPTRRPYMLGGMWYDSKEKVLYAPMHCEYYAGGDQPHLQIGLATSTDKGLTWHYEGLIVTRDVPGGTSLKPSEFSGIHWDGGAGDFYIYVDERGGYIYLYSMSYIQIKKGLKDQPFLNVEVARCAISDKMMPGKWHKFHNGKWDDPGLGGKASYVNAYYVMYNTYLKKYIGFHYGNGIAVCTDLNKQDWSPIFKVPGKNWGFPEEYGFHVTDVDKANIFSGGQSLYLYSYWMATDYPKAKLYKIDFSTDQETSVNPVSPTGVSLYVIGLFNNPITSADPAKIYPLEPLYESADPIESRHTRRVHCTHAETKYLGTWNDEEYGACFEKAVKASEIPENAIQFTYQGADIYWRAVKGPDCGLADVYIDGVFQKTVDCYSNPQTAEQIAFLKTGLNTKVVHTIRVVVRGEKNAVSKGTKVKHLLFEYSAESYRASDGFSSIQGKKRLVFPGKNRDRLCQHGFRGPTMGW